MRARCLELLQVEVTVPTALPQSRCALTAPFHPCLSRSKYPAIGGLLSVALFRALPRMAVSHHLSYGVRTFLYARRCQTSPLISMPGSSDCLTRFARPSVAGSKSVRTHRALAQSIPAAFRGW